MTKQFSSGFGAEIQSNDPHWILNTSKFVICPNRLNYVVPACVSTVGIYAECNALSPEEPRHYNRATSENNLPNVVPCSTLLVKHEHVRLVAPSATGLKNRFKRTNARDHVGQRPNQQSSTDSFNISAVRAPTSDCGQNELKPSAFVAISL